MSDLPVIGIVGGGLIGMSWAALALACGAEVIVVDPRPEAEAETRDFIAAAWQHLRALDIATGGTPPRARVTADMSALADAGFVQECGPDRIGVKHDIVARIEAAVGAQVVIASSTSSLMASDIQARARHPDRILVGHPMNPPHLVPMVELVAGRATSQAAMDTAEQMYLALHRVPIRVKKELPGHLANRLTAALYREAVHIAAEGIADVADIDRAIAYGPGMRWALMGPHLIYHLGGGAGGYRHYLDHLGPTQEARWKALGTPSLSPQVRETLVAGVEAELAQTDKTTLTARRDDALVALAKLKQTYGF
ncbi:3-hydroxyacyl-CoA dehydrogenase NAD-binding domain-containing protein [Sulfitobacter sabulilitoris]|uniref:3-hydroxybutyryl-CoA dehydrogenase n=1 Tax=Sulfitobacter sabulilitoris TaxID=2562655 RepID=A0A5S3PCG4_9RHOB|nr:3-hydroxyacyl-CoA dehydrogenase NAD-binding domain-containing protein [Sulfitobacter sabulilitoris]TMM51287.1 3-hydroxybutyryl-CoA dehydrogenase [Sulfitobacter sabulilitoris]